MATTQKAYATDIELPSGSKLPDSVNPSSTFTKEFFQSAGLYSKEEIKYARFNGFSRFGRILDPYGRLTGCREYLFFVKPDLHICMPYYETVNSGVYNISNGDVKSSDNVFIANSLRLNPQLGTKQAGNMFFKDLLERHPDVCKELQYSCESSNSPFCNLLSFQVNSNLELPNSDFNTLDNSATMFGTTYEYLYDAEESDEGITFMLDFVDDKDLDVYAFFKAYSEYHNVRKSGLVTPPSLDYYKYKRLHNTMGIYKFIVGEDMETLIHWSYFWGVIPSSIPREAFNDPSWPDNGISFSVSFKAAWMKDYDPLILAQFNQMMGKIKSTSENYLGVTHNVNLNASGNLSPKVIKTGNIVSDKGQMGTFDEGVPENSYSNIINGTIPTKAYVEYVPVDTSKGITKSSYKLRWYV